FPVLFGNRQGGSARMVLNCLPAMASRRSLAGPECLALALTLLSRLNCPNMERADSLFFSKIIETANAQIGNLGGKSPAENLRRKIYASLMASMAAISASHTSTPSTKARPEYHHMVRR